MADEKVLVVENVKKRYGEVEALKGVSFEVRACEVFGILGPNGAGKSSLIKILTCFSRPSSGSVKIGGVAIAHVRKIKRLIGWVPQEDTFYGKLSVEENLVYFGSLYDVPKREMKEKIPELLRLVGIEQKRKAVSESLSGGMKRRLSIAIALIHDPKVVYLDEPTAGVDPVSRMELWSVVDSIRKGGMTVLFCTHYLDEAERLCDRIAILKAGEVVAVGTPAELKKKYGKTMEEVFVRVVKGNVK